MQSKIPSHTPDGSRLSVVGVFVCLSILFSGLILTAIAAHEVHNTLLAVAFVLLGPTLTFVLVLLAGHLDYLACRGLSKLFHWHEVIQTPESRLTFKESFSSGWEFIKMLFLRLSTISVLVLFASLFYAAFGAKNGQLVIGLCVLVLALFGALRRP